MSEAPKKSAAERLAEMRARPIPRAKPVAAPDAAEANRQAFRLVRAEQEWARRQEELGIRRQQAIDAVWERTLEARREQEEAAGRSCHRGPGDPDYWQR
jgi:hypothetical protein